MSEEILSQLHDHEKIFHSVCAFDKYGTTSGPLGLVTELPRDTGWWLKVAAIKGPTVLVRRVPGLLFRVGFNGETSNECHDLTEAIVQALEWGAEGAHDAKETEDKTE